MESVSTHTTQNLEAAQATIIILGQCYYTVTPPPGGLRSQEIEKSKGHQLGQTQGPPEHPIEWMKPGYCGNMSYIGTARLGGPMGFLIT